MNQLNIITPKEVEKLLKEGKQLNIIDVRELEEVEEGMIPTAKHIPLGELPVQYKELDDKKDYILVCRSGSRGARACQFLMQHGFSVMNMDGGMLNWEAEVE